ncbi:MerR family transcriptional regulator [Nocardia takedensis]
MPSRQRTVDVARAAGYSVQQIRDLEREGVLPAAERTAAGHRRYDESHVSAALAYRWLTVGAGPVEAKRILRAVRTRPLPEALAMLDAVHTDLDTQRRDLAAARRAAEFIAAEPIAEVRVSDAMTISELARALGVRTSTLRHWETEHLLAPTRDRTARRYSPEAVRDARIVHQLRLAGYRVPDLRSLMPRLRAGRDIETLAEGLAARDRILDGRSFAMLEAAAALSALLKVERCGDAHRQRRRPCGKSRRRPAGFCRYRGRAELTVFCAVTRRPTDSATP